MDTNFLLQHLRCIPDFPKKGINFRDVTTLYQNAQCFKILTDEITNLYKEKGITKIVGIESRGFIIASAVAYQLQSGVVLARKKGKLPAKTLSESYQKEYGTDTIEIHEDAITSNDIVLLHDDLLATGWTLKAVENLVKKFHPKKIYINVLIEITDEGLQGRKQFEDTEVTSLLVC